MDLSGTCEGNAVGLESGDGEACEEDFADEDELFAGPRGAADGDGGDSFDEIVGGGDDGDAADGDGVFEGDDIAQEVDAKVGLGL